MPDPDSSHAVILETTTPVATATTQLQTFLDKEQYAAVAVVHGQGRMADRAFNTAKDRYAPGRGALWIQDAAILDKITDLTADELDLFKPTQGHLVNFVNVRAGSIAKSLKWFQISAPDFDQAYLQASQV